MRAELNHTELNMLHKAFLATGILLLSTSVNLATDRRDEDSKEVTVAAAQFFKAFTSANTDNMKQHFADSMGIWRNHLEGVLGVLHQHTDLTEEEVAKLQSFFE